MTDYSGMSDRDIIVQTATQVEGIQKSFAEVKKENTQEHRDIWSAVNCLRGKRDKLLTSIVILLLIAIIGVALGG